MNINFIVFLILVPVINLKSIQEEYIPCLQRRYSEEEVDKELSLVAIELAVEMKVALSEDEEKFDKEEFNVFDYDIVTQSTVIPENTLTITTNPKICKKRDLKETILEFIKKAASEETLPIQKTEPNKKKNRRKLLNKIYSCRFCNKDFKDWSNRTRHERTHTNEKPYACDKCKKAFSNSSNRKEHEKKCSL